MTKGALEKGAGGRGCAANAKEKRKGERVAGAAGLAESFNTVKGDSIAPAQRAGIKNQRLRYWI